VLLIIVPSFGSPSVKILKILSPTLWSALKPIRLSKFPTAACCSPPFLFLRLTVFPLSNQQRTEWTFFPNSRCPFCLFSRTWLNFFISRFKWAPDLSFAPQLRIQLLTPPPHLTNTSAPLAYFARGFLQSLFVVEDSRRAELSGLNKPPQLSVRQFPVLFFVKILVLPIKGAFFSFSLF